MNPNNQSRIFFVGNHRYKIKKKPIKPTTIETTQSFLDRGGKIKIIPFSMPIIISECPGPGER